MNLQALVIDPDVAHRQSVRDILSDDGWQVSEAHFLVDVPRTAIDCSWDLIFYDRHLSAAGGGDSSVADPHDLLRRRLTPAGQLIAMAAAGRASIAFEAILNGAADYLNKPCPEQAVRDISQRASARIRASAKEMAEIALPACASAVHAPQNEHQLIGESEAILEVYKTLARSVRDIGSDPGRGKEIVRPPAHLITGETGTGKELVARLIHRHSAYGRGPFVALNCSNLSPELADAELFGSSPGAYTGAAREGQPGLWELASGGTLFLDEITEAPQVVLPKLLRALQEGQIKRLGAKRWIKVNTQIVAATNRNIALEIECGRLRADLYHRLSLFTVNLPPLRERKPDIPLLARHFALIHSGGAVKLSRDALELLIRFSNEYPWPGNVRELENIIRRAVSESLDATIYAIDLKPYLARLNHSGETWSGERTLNQVVDVKHREDHAKMPARGLEEMVRRYKLDVLKETLAVCNSNYTRAAKELRISRPTLYRLLKEGVGRVGVKPESDAASVAQEQDLNLGMS